MNDFASNSRARTLFESVKIDDRIQYSSMAFVTPTYWRDLARCELLAESLDRCAPDVPHYLIVDRRDRAAFAHLQQGRRRVIASEELIDSDFWRLPGSSGWWLNFKTPPVRGWIMQQIKKIAAITVIPEDLLIFCDSDAAFFERFGLKDLLLDNKIGLLDVEFMNGDTKSWTATSRRLLGIKKEEQSYRNYVGYLVCWDRNIVNALQRRIEAVSGSRWQLSLARTLNFSEYMLYGIFVSELLGYKQTNHKPSNVPLIKPRWAANDDVALDDLLNDIDPRTIGVMVHSKDGIDPKQVRGLLEKRWPKIERGGS